MHQKRTPRGLIWLDEWGVNRYAANFAFLMLHSNTYLDRLSPAEKRQWSDIGKSQIDYMLGDSGRSYVIGFGNNYPKRPHHRYLSEKYKLVIFINLDHRPARGSKMGPVLEMANRETIHGFYMVLL